MADIALRRQRDVHYLTTLAIVNAIIHLGSVITGNATGNDAVKKVLDNLKVVLFPEEEAKLEARAEEIKALMTRELKRGPLTVQAVDNGSKRGRKRRRR